MKKIVSILLVLVTVLSMGTMAFADGTTTLTTTVPAATYTLNIPADQKVEFNTLLHTLETPTIANESGFAVGKNILVSITHTDFTCAGLSTTIPFALMTCNDGGTRVVTDEIKFEGNNEGKVGEAKREDGNGFWLTVSEMYLSFADRDWGKALGGDYTATITFTSEVVAE